MTDEHEINELSMLPIHSFITLTHSPGITCIELCKINCFYKHVVVQQTYVKRDEFILEKKGATSFYSSIITLPLSGSSKTNW
jgi:hypothetical protein